MCTYCGWEELCHVGTSIPVYIKRVNLGRRGTSFRAVRYSREGRGSQTGGVPWSYEAATRPIGRAASWQGRRLSSSESEASRIHGTDQGSKKQQEAELWLNGYGTGASLVAQAVKKLPAMQETGVWSLGWEDPLEKGMATHSSILAWRIPWTEQPGRLSSWTHKELVMTQWLTLLHSSLVSASGQEPRFPCSQCRTLSTKSPKSTEFPFILLFLALPLPLPFYCTVWGSELSASVKLPPRISWRVIMYMFGLAVREML